MKSFKSAFILGSTSKVARAICIKLAKTGCKRFHLVCRDLNGNQSLIDELETFYKATVTQEENDLFSNTSINNSLIPEIGFYDLYLITAGSLGDARLAREDISEALRITSANFSGILPWLTAITNYNRLKSAGSLWVFSSVAADRGRPSNYHYGAAKAALSTFCEGLLLRCQDKPFSVRIIKAGFMATPMAIDAPPSLCISPNSVARHLMRNPNRRGIEYLPWWWSLIMFLVRILPNQFAAKL
tara:strand:+ start:569 stop:1297 length:729 start_codon:yes stop_codon:yes gene_type:complete